MNTNEPTNNEIETQRLCGEIHNVLESGSVEERGSMLRLIADIRTPEEYTAIRDSHQLNDDGTNK